MAEKSILPKGEILETAIQKVLPQLGKDVQSRAWTKGAYAALQTYIAEGCGAKFPNKEARDKFRTIQTDSDVSFSSNMKAYLQGRGLLPKAPTVPAGNFE